MLDVLPLVHRKSVYISRTLLPSCRLVKVEDAAPFPLKEVLSVGLVGPLEIDLGRVGSAGWAPVGPRGAEVGRW